MRTLTRVCLFLLLPLLIVSCVPRRSIEPSFVFEEPHRPHLPQPPLVCIDAGHGGKDPGAESAYHGYEEKVLTLQTAQMVQNFLNQLGYRTEMTRHHDHFVPLEKRAEMANVSDADLFVSIHYNHAPSVSAKGIEVFYFEDEADAGRVTESKRLGRRVLSRLIERTGANSRGVKTAKFVVIKKTNMPAILIEGGFLTNVEERKRLQDPHYIHFVALGIAQGIDAYFHEEV